MIVQLDMHPTDAAALVKFLNDDAGLRNAVAEKLIPQNKPENVAKLTSVVTGLAAVSRALSLALEAQAQFDADFKAQRAAEEGAREHVGPTGAKVIDLMAALKESLAKK